MGSKTIAALAVIALLIGSHLYAYRAGWSAHSDKVNREYAEAKNKSEIKQVKSTQSSNEQKVIVETKYKTITKDVVRYVQNPNRTVCSFDDEWLRIRNAAIDADKSVSRDAK